MAPTAREAAVKRPASAEATDAGEQLPKKRMRSSYTTSIKVIVGVESNQETFSVHEDMICDKSSFFKAACSKDWLENQEKTVRLPEQEVDTFRMYLDCVYQEKIDYVTLADLPITVKGNKIRMHSADLGRKGYIAGLRLCKLWALADYLGDTTTQNEVIDCLVTLVGAVRQILGFEAVEFIGNNTQVQSGLHRWMLNYLATIVNEDCTDAVVKYLPLSSMSHLLKEFVKLRGVGAKLPRPETSAQFHT